MSTGTAGTAAMRSQTLDTPDGPFTIVESADGDVMASGWSADIRAVSARAGIPPESVIAGESHSAPAVRSFYEGDASGIAAVSVRSKGTDFQEKVWEYLRSIPAGEVRTYSEVAAALGRPRAFRKVAQACGRDPASLLSRVTGWSRQTARQRDSPGESTSRRNFRRVRLLSFDESGAADLGDSGGIRQGRPRQWRSGGVIRIRVGERRRRLRRIDADSLF
jgi:methylated-DNA-[protein]-cysteine S-methyltransferase